MNNTYLPFIHQILIKRKFLHSNGIVQATTHPPPKKKLLEAQGCLALYSLDSMIF